MVLTTDNQQREYSAHQKASYVTFLLLQGNELTTAGIATLTGLTWEGAEYMMDMISGVLPIVKVNGKWRKME
jgi:hypothetical protein